MSRSTQTFQVLHDVGGAAWFGGSLMGLLLADRDRAARQPGVRGNTVVKTVLTLLAALATLYSGILGGRVARAGDVPAESSVAPDAATPPDVADAQNQLRALQFAIPALTGSVVALGAQQSQLQRPEHQARGLRFAADRGSRVV
ncbi:MAG: hypothetical protein ACFCVG_13285 [Kineosporiaceae bacterium]